VSDSDNVHQPPGPNRAVPETMAETKATVSTNRSPRGIAVASRRGLRSGSRAGATLGGVRVAPRATGVLADTTRSLGAGIDSAGGAGSGDLKGGASVTVALREVPDNKSVSRESDPSVLAAGPAPADG
jgi:hypothetical protein